MRSNLCLLLLLAACTSEIVDHDDSPPDAGGTPPDAPGTVVDAPLPSPDAAVAPPPRPRVVAIGDLHGDYASTLEAFRVGGLIDAENHWIGGTSTAVQVGDQLDRGSGEKEILDFLDAVTVEAEAAGGKVIVINGNHELMNVDQDFRFVTADGLADFGGMAGRAAAFAPGGSYALRLARRPLYAIAGHTVFAHGGIRPEYVPDLAAIDSAARSWMMTGGPAPAVVDDVDGLIWTRDFGEPETPAACTDAEATLAALGVDRMVVAHTVQYTGINSICDGRVWRIDVGLSDYYDAFGAPKTQVLEIMDGKVEILTKE